FPATAPRRWREKKEMLFWQNEAERLLKTKDRTPENTKNEPENGTLSGESVLRNLLKTQDGAINPAKRTGNETEWGLTCCRLFINSCLGTESCRANLAPFRKKVIPAKLVPAKAESGNPRAAH
ncbi:MAG: hypothetical protein ACRD3T_11035, partial [Terriglobia bacterium]